MLFFTYILQCKDGTYYTGSTKDLEKRIYEHNHSKKGAHYTKIRRPVILKYFEQFPTLKKARARENYIKNLPRKKKEILWI